MCHATSDMAQVAKSSKARRCAFLAYGIVRDNPGVGLGLLFKKIRVAFPGEFNGEQVGERTAKVGIGEAEGQEWIVNRASGRGSKSAFHPLPGGQMATP